MVFAGERYYNVNRKMLTALGLWPYHNSTLQKACTVGIFISCLIFQLIPLLTRTCNIEYILRQLLFILPYLISLFYYNLFHFNATLIKQLFEEIKVDWNIAIKNGQVQILEKYMTYNYLLTFISFGNVLLGIFFLTCVELLPIGLDVFAPLNQSRPRKLKIVHELFIDEQQYFYTYLIVEIVGATIALFSMVGPGTFLLGYLAHCCATYKIASTLIENIATKDTIQISIDKKMHLMHRKISHAVRIHKKTIKFIKTLMSVLNKWFFMIMVLGVLSLSCNLLCFLNLVTSLKNIFEIMICLTLMIIHLMVMFFCNLVGQFVINHSAEMFHAVYRTMWYAAPLPIQKLLLFVMQCSLKNDTLFVGGLFVASLEGFSTLVTTSISYFTVVHNMK